MRNRLLLTFAVGILAITTPVFAQVTLKTGSIYGKVVSDQGDALPGVNILLQSEVIPSQSATSSASGGFRFVHLPPGTYSVTLTLEGFTEVRQERVEVATDTQVQLEITLQGSLAEEVTVIAETPVVDTKKTQVSHNFNRKHLQDVPSARDPWTIIDQTPGIDSDRYNVGGTESGTQGRFAARGAADDQTVWNYDGLDITDPGIVGASPTYFDFDAFEELSVTVGGNDVSSRGGVVVNIVTRRAGNKWEGNGSFYFVNDSLQGDNTPEELTAAGALSNRIDRVMDYGFDIGGPIVANKFFAWGAFHKNDVDLVLISGLLDQSEINDFNFKTSWNWSSDHESQFSYFNGQKTKSNRAGISPALQAEETLWQQERGSVLPGIWIGQHTWIPSNHTIITGRYGYIGQPQFSLSANGGTDKPMILLGAIPRWEQTFVSYAPTDRPSHTVVVDANHYRENLFGGDHEFKFGFEYKTSDIRSDSHYGNGLYIKDFYQTSPGGPLTYGYLYLIHNNRGRIKEPRTSFYVSDTYRKNRLTLNLGFRFDSQTGENLASVAEAPRGFENILTDLQFGGNDPGISFNDISPRLGATYDLTGDGKTVLRVNYARYYDAWDASYLQLSNPTYTYNGAYVAYANFNGDREVTQDEFISEPGYFGGAAPVFDLEAFNALKKYDPQLKNSGSNEFLAGFERQIARDVSVSITYTHRNYFDPVATLPLGVSAADYVPAGTFVADTVLGSFSVPTFRYEGSNDGTVILTNVKDYGQTYNGVDLAVRKRMSHNFMVQASLVLQKQKSQYNGGDSANYILPDGGLPGRAFPGNPGNVSFADDQPYGYSGGKFGIYPYSEWQFKLSGVYQLPYDISAGAYARYQQGYPFVLWGEISDPGLFPALGTSRSLVLVEPFGSRRYDNLFTLDAHVEKAFDLGQYGRFSLTAALFNVTNTNPVIRRNRAVETTTFNLIEEVISARALRVGVRYNF